MNRFWQRGAIRGNLDQVEDQGTLLIGFLRHMPRLNGDRSILQIGGENVRQSVRREANIRIQKEKYVTGRLQSALLTGPAFANPPCGLIAEGQHGYTKRARYLGGFILRFIIRNDDFVWFNDLLL
ncbi:hypothetical protein SDC9_152896 [bioreactor metagenome]|uniref:Uncharacterized protein n=1 Tax=bioreactor metagenome TaxID=1076179 RepID=A0A645EUE3_9ZZZZ